MVLGVIRCATIADTEVQHSIGPEGQITTVVVVPRLRHFQQHALTLGVGHPLGLGLFGCARSPVLAQHFGVTIRRAVVHEEAALVRRLCARKLLVEGQGQQTFFVATGRD